MDSDNVNMFHLRPEEHVQFKWESDQSRVYRALPVLLLIFVHLGVL